MFGTIARVRVQPGRDEELREVCDAWATSMDISVGHVAEYLFKLENSPDEYMMIGIFTDRDAYFRNASEPETNRWYGKMRELLVADPEWNDGEVVQAFMPSQDSVASQVR